MSSPFVIYVVRFERVDDVSQSIEFEVEALRSCQAKEEGFLKLEAWKYQQGVPMTEWRMRFARPK